MNTKSCNRCGKDGLVWRKSKAGNWYLAIETSVGGKRGGHLTIFPAHKCEINHEPGFADNGRNESFLFDLQARSGA